MSLPPAVILAGGLARRMGGGDKALLPLGNGTMLDLAIARILPQCGALALNANGDAARFAVHGLPILSDGLPGHPGPLAGVLAAMDWAAAMGTEAVVTLPCDTPFFPTDLVARLIAARTAAQVPVALAASGDPAAPTLHPTFGLWSVAGRGALAEMLASGQRRVRAFAEAQGMAHATFAEDDAFFNVNTPDDLRAAEARLAAIRPAS